MQTPRSVSDTITSHPYTSNLPQAPLTTSRSSTSLNTTASTKPSSSSSNLPSIRSFRSRFQSFSVGSKKRLGPKVVTGGNEAELKSDGTTFMVYSGATGGGSLPSMRKGGGIGSPGSLTMGNSPELAQRKARPSIDSTSFLPRRTSTNNAGSPITSPPPTSALPPPNPPPDSPPSPYIRRSSSIPTPTATSPTTNKSLFELRSGKRLSTIPDRIASPGGFRISSDFERPTDQPSLAQLRTNSLRKKSEVRGEGVRSPTRSSLGMATRAVVTTTTTTPRLDVESPVDRKSVYTPIKIAPSTFLGALRKGSGDSGATVPSNERPFSPTPVQVSPSITLLQHSPAMDQALKNDFAFRRHSIASSRSPVLGTSANGKRSSSRISTTPSRSESVSAPEAASGSGEKERPRLSSLEMGGMMGLGIDSPQGSDVVVSFSNHYGSTRGSPTGTSTPLISNATNLPKAIGVPSGSGGWRSPIRSTEDSMAVDGAFAIGPIPFTPDRNAGLRPRSANYATRTAGSVPPHESPAPSTASYDAGSPATRTARLQKRHSTAESYLSSPGRSDAHGRPHSRASGHTFGGINEDSASINESRSRPSSFRADQLDEPLSTSSTTDLHRSRSAYESARAAGGAEVNTVGTVEQSSPVYVLTAEDFGGTVYRSASSRLANPSPTSMRGLAGDLEAEVGSGSPKKRVGKHRKVRSEGSPVGKSKAPKRISLEREQGANSRQLEYEAHENEAEEFARQLGSPLQDLIMGLGGHHSSFGSARTKRMSMNSGHVSDDVLEPNSPSPSSRAVALPSSIPFPSNAHSSPVATRTSAVPSVEISQSNAEGKPRDFVHLSVDEMENEIERMEAELKSGASPKIGVDSNSDQARNTTPTAATPHPSSIDKSSLGFPTPPSRAMAVTMTRSFSGTSNTSSQADNVTPRTARRWSIIEIELAYQRMKLLLGSSKSAGAASDSGTLGESVSEFGDTDIEGAFERALRGSRGSRTTDDGADEVLDNLMLLLPNNLSPGPSPVGYSPGVSTASGWPRTDSAPQDDTEKTPKLLQRDDEETEVIKHQSSPMSSSGSGGGVSTTSALFSGVSRKTSQESFTELAKGSSEKTTKARRRHTLAAPLRREDLEDVFQTELEQRARSRTGEDRSTSALQRRAQESGRQPARLTTDNIPPSNTSEAGFATPLSSPIASTNRTSARSPSRASSVAAGGLRSGAGREWARENSLRHLQDSDRATSPAYSLMVSEAHPDVSSREPSPLPTSKRPTMNGNNRRWTQDSATDSMSMLNVDPHPTKVLSSDNWFPATPDRATHRQTAKASRRAEVIQSLHDNKHSLTLTEIKGMDKLEIFFRFTATKAELDKAETERDALLDALQECRATLSDVRSQRDDLEAELRRERSAARQMKKTLSEDSEAQATYLEELLRARQKWEVRAREALEDMEHEREDAEELRCIAVEGRDREERLERELALLAAKLAVSQADAQSWSAQQAHGRRTSSAGVDGDISHSIEHSPSHTNSSAARSRHTSPIVSTSRQTNHRSSASDLQPEELQTPASKLAAAYRERTPSTASSSGLPDFGDIVSPLMGQRMAFGPKSSFGSVGTPLKMREVQRPLRESLLLGVASRTPNRRASKESTTSSDWDGEHLPQKIDRPWNPSGSGSTMPELNERDEAFLSDLSGPIEVDLKGPIKT